ncbi:hypothetical protein B0H67DRAFT_558358 [Lasiosphaeris hirsuta]|uniref:Aminoglycoside phosphotransferase domain-containing protein n=1 Tax=Lasiosphaeris hirsuta TaxID=260670 RepID=A0AA39ZSB1_9PEZI|nr:hypothetical protein B0H67DRAFT_558358 [Lasiosphaeris hirsuta]
MFANPSHHVPLQPLSSNPAQDVDPFQSLYDALSNLTLDVTPSSATLDNGSRANSSHVPDTPAGVDSSRPSDIPVNLIFPSGDNVIFAHSSFFKHPCGADLPTPAAVRSEAARLFEQGYLPVAATSRLVPFPSLGLLVKYGADVSTTEAKCLLLLRRLLSSSVPVPEVFGWRRDGDERFIYMELPDGMTLEERWAWMREAERKLVYEELRGMVNEWRRLRQGGREIVGSIDNSPVRDGVFTSSQGTMKLPPAGPFADVAKFHSYFVATAVAISECRQGGAETGRVDYKPHHLLPNEVPIAFTHGALHPRNVIVSRGPNPHIVSIIGWDQAGWYPAYWELCKARMESSAHGDAIGWDERYVLGVLDLDRFEQKNQGWNYGALCQYWDYFVGLMR